MNINSHIRRHYTIHNTLVHTHKDTDMQTGNRGHTVRDIGLGKGTHRTERDTGGHGRTAGGTDSGTGTPSGKGTHRSERDTADPEKDTKKGQARGKTRPGVEGHSFGTENRERDTQKGSEGMIN